MLDSDFFVVQHTVIHLNRSEGAMSFKIAGKDFYQYVAYRLKKDGLGFIPGREWKDGATDCKTYIKSIVPKTSYDFLVYTHELGHCKSVQLPSTSNAFFDNTVSPERITNEYNAWVWAFRYLKKLGITYSKDEILKALNDSFRSYTKNARDIAQANNLIKKLNNLLGIDLHFEVAKKTCYDAYGYTSLAGYPDMRMWEMKDLLPINSPGNWEWSVFTTPEKKKKQPTVNKKHMPWMDLLDKQRKKYDKHAGKR
jgi:hypothetical protein